MAQTFPKAEHLSGTTGIGRLLKEGKWGGLQDLKYCVVKDNGLEYSRFMVSVPKKFFKRAVKRNLLKRRIREAYRLQKSTLPQGRGMDIMVVYNSKAVLSSEDLFSRMGTILERLAQGE